MSDLSLNIKLTDAGMAAIAAAHGQGLAAKISHVAVGDIGYAPTAAATGLQHEQARVALTAGGAIAPQQVLLQGMIPAGETEFFIRELGYFLDDGTLLGVWSDPVTPLGWIGAVTPWFFKLVFAWSSLPTDAITVIIADDAGQAGLALDLAQLEGKVRHTVESADIVWSGEDITQLTQAIAHLIVSSGALRRTVSTPNLAAGYYSTPLALEIVGGVVTPTYIDRNVMTLAVTSSITLAAPETIPAGGGARIIATIDATGNRALTLASAYRVIDGEWAADAGVVNILDMVFGGPGGLIDVQISQRGEA
ncbi:hypothetical protein KL86APRO_12522 [uncultured Alphaproteobacteria bacterium]|uniref:Phage tail fibre protein N-terminal domain-containing protein n=1 Tax=uncultured Alphaproteobacteria bacterium TaxID=91750 RepID=A0A212KBN4_9PROT|nr:hypothetical protein KL86APRO_12522 [uncultured Alphaproteobacteria bacterium]